MLIRRKYKRYSKQKMTYLGLIAYVIQNAPEKKLTFYEVPINPKFPSANRNFWKVDDSKITPKILRRHLSGLRDVFPDLYENMEIPFVRNATENRTTCKNPVAEKKFTSPFSIESLLQRESSAPVRHKPALCATKNLENAIVGFANGDRGLACKRKSWDLPYHLIDT